QISRWIRSPSSVRRGARSSCGLVCPHLTHRISAILASRRILVAGPKPYGHLTIPGRCMKGAAPPSGNGKGWNPPRAARCGPLMHAAAAHARRRCASDATGNYFLRLDFFADFFAPDFFAAGFFAAAFLAADFFVAAFLATTWSVAAFLAVASCAAAFVVVAFLAASCCVAAFLAVAFFTAVLRAACFTVFFAPLLSAGILALV